MAKRGIVHCRGCNKEINKATDKYEMPVTNYYYGIDCGCFAKYEANVKKEKEEIEKTKKIHSTCQNLFGTKYRKSKVTKQINSYVSDGHTLDEILRGIDYWFCIKKQSTEKACGGIGILDYVWDEIENYYSEQKVIQEINESGGFEYFKNPDNKVYKIKRTPIKAPLRLIDLDFTVD